MKASCRDVRTSLDGVWDLGGLLGKGRTPRIVIPQEVCDWFWDGALRHRTPDRPCTVTKTCF